MRQMKSGDPEALGPFKTGRMLRLLGLLPVLVTRFLALAAICSWRIWLSYNNSLSSGESAHSRESQLQTRPFGRFRFASGPVGGNR